MLSALAVTLGVAFFGELAIMFALPYLLPSDASELTRILKSGAHAAEVYEDMWRTVANGGTWNGDVCDRNKAGGFYWVHATITPFMNERGKLAYLNAEAERLIGWRMAERIGASLHDIIHHHRPDGTVLPATECPIRLAMRDHRVYRSSGEVSFHKDGFALPVKITGAPLALDGAAIPLHGRIVAVADVFDALTSERPCKKAWTLEAAVDFLKSNSRSHFDPACVAAFLAAWPQMLKIHARYRDKVHCGAAAALHTR